MNDVHHFTYLSSQLSNNWKQEWKTVIT